MQYYDAFISHASDDKDRVTRPLAEALINRGFKIWYDEFELKIGKSLSESIDKGLTKSRFGIVILSKHFFSKSWPKRELRGLVAQEVANKGIILPIWHEISKEEVMRYSPPLADLVSISTEKGLNTVIEAIIDAFLGDSVLSNRLSQRSDYKENFSQLLQGPAFTLPIYRIATFLEKDTALGVGALSALLAQKIGWQNEQIEQINIAATLRNIGFVGISEQIRYKPGRLSENEFETYKIHTSLGEQILSNTGDPYFNMSAIVAKSHHERWDGSGYPIGLEGNAIPEAGRIVAITDVYYALIKERPYKQAFSEKKALEIMDELKGRHLDPFLFDIFNAEHVDFQLVLNQLKEQEKNENL
jgi:hypothetical protein